MYKFIIFEIIFRPVNGTSLYVCQSVLALLKGSTVPRYPHLTVAARRRVVSWIIFEYAVSWCCQRKEHIADRKPCRIHREHPHRVQSANKYRAKFEPCTFVTGTRYTANSFTNIWSYKSSTRFSIKPKLPPRVWSGIWSVRNTQYTVYIPAMYTYEMHLGCSSSPWSIYLLFDGCT